MFRQAYMLLGHVQVAQQLMALKTRNLTCLKENRPQPTAPFENQTSSQAQAQVNSRHTVFGRLEVPVARGWPFTAMSFVCTRYSSRHSARLDAV